MRTKNIIALFSLILGFIPIQSMELSSAQSITCISPQSNQCEILPATEQDLDELYQFWHEQWYATYQIYYSQELLKQTFREFFNINHLKEMMSAGAQFLKVMDADDHIIGTASGEKRENDTLFISKMYIDRFQQKTGIGSRLVQALIDQFKPKRVRVIVQEVNLSGRRFFEKLGLQYETPKAKKYSFNSENFDYFYMSKTIENEN